ncbi:hypothetical protein GA830_02470 [Mesorhizobium sp. NBSH29]|uniref:hypothetical protein n=1 Tax=Mesorhizobium sp. NBSH29 TaxID=2654249 RepID=UPI0018964D7E|nr:hypothetical protein [Mesorhizobium sp. NBSH29]QPC85721.1 hypothetical protein GA830_02470 [Mesorhizobium sp. NBSH29]
MEHIAALLLIIGCSNDLGECKELPAPAPIFETAGECMEALPEGIATYAGRHPRVIARCIDVDPAMEEEYAELTWDVTKEGVLIANLETPVLVASNAESTQPVSR